MWPLDHVFGERLGSKLRPVISLLTDFGLGDPYVAQVKAVILSYCRDAAIIDLTHEVQAFNELQAAFILKVSAPHMPEGTIHLCVIDPGVGTRRRGIILETARGDVFIGPDTGFMAPAAEELGVKAAYVIDESKLPARRSETFHARDVFAHVAGRLALGAGPRELGERAESYSRMVLPEPRPTAEGVEAMIMHVDRFGNLITNLKPENLSSELGEELLIELPSGKLRCRLVKSYGHVPEGSPLLTVGGTGYVELSVNRGSAAERFRLKPGDRILVRRG